ncbi:arylsulfatase [Sulfuritalea hydrogenivorans]|nr:arylsulfatase [Sulfuritalea hydrogenivorans]
MPKIVPIRPPEKAPNIVVVLLDDVGFGAAGTFGGPVATPALDELAREGLRYNRFHTTALSSPSRAALLTGRNHHRVNAGGVTEFATGFDGYNSIIPKAAATIARVLRDNGYSTAAYGKWHNTPVWEISPAGPFDRWPTGLGFDEFYGFMGGEAHQYSPGLYRGTTPVERSEHAKHYHLTTDLADQAIAWMHTQKAMTPDKPFFVYWAPGATHAPFQVYPEWVKPYEGKFEQGWDQLREEIFTRQKKLGVIPRDAKLTPRHESIPAWNSLSPDRKRLASRLMEVYAGFLAHTDHEVGRLMASLRDMKEWENTLFIYIVGDNGAAPAGGIDGVFNEMVTLNGLKEDPAVVMSRLDQIGGPKANSEYPVGFAWAMNTPFQYTKQIASHLGGTRNPMVVSWPNRIKGHGGLRSQFHHLIDIAPTIYDAAGIPAPKRVDGVDQMPLDGISMTYTFDDAGAGERRKTQYFEIQGRRGIYHDGWLAGTTHNFLLWQRKSLQAFDKDRWELYHLDNDFSQSADLADREPEKLEQLKALFLAQARENRVLPLDDRGPARAMMSPRPTLMGKRKSIRLTAGATRLPEDVIRAFFNRPYAITATFASLDDIPADGVLLAAGGYFAGLSLYVKAGIPHFTYNYFGSNYTTLAGSARLPQGKVTLKMEFDYPSIDLGMGGTARLLVNGRIVAEKPIPATVPLGFSADETLDVGRDTGTPAADTYESPFPFNGKIESVELTTR